MLNDTLEGTLALFPGTQFVTVILFSRTKDQMRPLITRTRKSHIDKGLLKTYAGYRVLFCETASSFSKSGKSKELECISQLFIYIEPTDDFILSLED